jgi:imidazolonepropionase-like amidohydrolase
MKVPRDFGTVEVGMRADLLLLDANPLESVANVSKRVGVMARGRWLPESELRKMLENVAALNQK